MINYILFNWADGGEKATLSLSDSARDGHENSQLNYEKEFFEKNQKAIPKQLVSYVLFCVLDLATALSQELYFIAKRR